MNRSLESPSLLRHLSNHIWQVGVVRYTKTTRVEVVRGADQISSRPVDPAKIAPCNAIQPCAHGNQYMMGRMERRADLIHQVNEPPL
jgi:hypothetical protein